MFSKNLKYFRLKKGLTKKALADQANVSPMTITNYESGKRKPDMETLKGLAEVLEVRVSDFLAVRNEDMMFVHGEFILPLPCRNRNLYVKAWRNTFADL